MQDQHTWSAAMRRLGQIGADRSPISLKFSHTTLLKNARNTVLQEAENTCSVRRWPKYPFLDGSLEQCSAPAPLDNCEATAPSYIVSTDVNSGATRQYKQSFLSDKDKNGNGKRRLEMRTGWGRNEKQISTPTFFPSQPHSCDKTIFERFFWKGFSPLLEESTLFLHRFSRDRTKDLKWVWVTPPVVLFF
jgi:hypothetical protein